MRKLKKRLVVPVRANDGKSKQNIAVEKSDVTEIDDDFVSENLGSAEVDNSAETIEAIEVVEEKTVEPVAEEAEKEVEEEILETEKECGPAEETAEEEIVEAADEHPAEEEEVKEEISEIAEECGTEEDETPLEMTEGESQEILDEEASLDGTADDAEVLEGEILEETENVEKADEEEAEEVLGEEVEEVAEEESEKADEEETEEVLGEEVEEVAEEESEKADEEDAEEVLGEEVEEVAEEESEKADEEEAEEVLGEEVEEVAEEESENADEEEAEEVLGEGVEEIAEEESEKADEEEAEEVLGEEVEEIADEELETAENADENAAEPAATEGEKAKPDEKEGFKLTAPANQEEILSKICVKRGRKLIYRPNEIVFNCTAVVVGTDKNNEEGIKVKNILDEEIKQGVKLGYIDKFDGLKMSEIKEEYENDIVYEYAEQEFKRTGLVLDGDKIKVYIYDWDMKALHHVGMVEDSCVDALKPYLENRDNYSFDICGLITGGKYRKVIKDESGKVTVEKGNDGKLGIELDISILNRKD